MFLQNRNIISKIKRSKVIDYAALTEKNEGHSDSQTLRYWGNLVFVGALKLHATKRLDTERLSSIEPIGFCCWLTVARLLVFKFQFFLSIMFIGFGINYSFLKIKTVPRCPITIVVVIVSDSKTSV